MIILRDEEEIETKGESEEDSMSPLEDYNSECVEYPIKKEALVTRQALHEQMKNKDGAQQENIFHT